MEESEEIGRLEVLMAPPHTQASIYNGHIALKTSFAHSTRAPTIPGARFVGKGQDYWKVPLSWTSVVCMVNTFKGKLDMSDELVAWINAEWENKVSVCNKLRTGNGEEFVTDELLDQFDALIPPERSPKTPVDRRYQVAGALLLATAKRYLLLDQQGTGKMTQVAMALSLYPSTLPALIVAPASTLYAWQKELAVFGVDCVVLDGSAAQRRKKIAEVEAEGGPQVAVCSYNVVWRHSRVAGYGNIKLSDDHRTPKELNEIPWATVVADEAHKITKPHAVQTRAVWAVSDRAQYRWATTGTPVEQSPLDFWALLRFVDPVSWPSKTDFQDRWVDYEENWFGGIDVHGIRDEALPEWRQVTEWMWRRKMSTGLPPVENEVRYCELKGKHLKAYQDMERQLMAEFGEEVLFAPNHMTKRQRLIQLASSMIEVETDTETGEIVVTPIEPSPKLDLMMDTIEDFEGMPVLLWFSSTKFMDLARTRLSDAGIDHGVIEGKMSAKARHDVVERFQNGDLDMVLISVGAGAEGITLTRAPVSIHVQRPDSSILEDQKKYRNVRIGADHDQMWHVDLVTKGSAEEKQMEDQIKKVQVRDQVIDPNATS